MADVTVHSCQCPDCQAGHEHRDRQRHHQINLVMSRLDEQQGRWLAALEPWKVGFGDPAAGAGGPAVADPRDGRRGRAAGGGRADGATLPTGRGHD